MAQTFEFALVLLLSSTLAGASLAVFSSFAGIQGELQNEAVVASLSNAAWVAIRTGGSSLTLILSNASISCSRGQVAYSAGHFSSGFSIPADCSFSTRQLSGSNTLVFSFDSSVLRMVTK